MESWFITFSSKMNEENKKDWAWQNPIYMIEAGWTQIITGFGDKDVKIGDIAYIYGGGKKLRKKNQNGLWGVGKVIDILTPQIEKRKGFVVELYKFNKDETPLFSGSGKQYIKDLCGLARLRHGWHKLNNDQIAILEADINK